MLEPWNDRSLLPPPVHTALCDFEIDLKGLQHTLENIIRILEKQLPLHKESAILSRLLYKYDKKFRHDIGYRYLKKVNCALRRYIFINLLKDTEQFLSVLPGVEDSSSLYVPTKQMFQYLLIRIIAFSKLMFRIVVSSKQAATFYLDRLKRGESHWMSLMPYAVLSRIWSMVFVLLQHSCTWYQLLYPFLDTLPFKGLKFLPDNYELPTNLGDWLEIQDINDFGHLEWTSKETVNVCNLLINEDDDDDNVFENILQYVNEVNEIPKEFEKQSETLKKDINVPDLNVTVKQIDQGEAISRDSFKRMINKESCNEDISTKKNNYYHVIDNVTNKNTLQKFIEMEETFRNEGNKRSLTNHLTFMQWQSLKQILLKLDSSTLNNRKLQRRFQKIWHEKCVDVE